jgi:hypothetical protein
MHYNPHLIEEKVRGSISVLKIEPQSNWFEEPMILLLYFVSWKCQPKLHKYPWIQHKVDIQGDLELHFKNIHPLEGIARKWKNPRDRTCYLRTQHFSGLPARSERTDGTWEKKTLPFLLLPWEFTYSEVDAELGNNPERPTYRIWLR